MYIGDFLFTLHFILLRQSDRFRNRLKESRKGTGGGRFLIIDANSSVLLTKQVFIYNTQGVHRAHHGEANHREIEPLLGRG